MAAVLKLLHPEAPLPESLGNQTVRVNHGEIGVFCQLVGEKNPIHTDREAARKAGFSDIIAPGVMTLSYVSGFIAEKLPGAVLRTFQQMHFHDPVYPGNEIVILLSVSNQHLRKGRRFVDISFMVNNNTTGKRTLNGLCHVILPVEMA
ncbi:MaoC family dehydratase [Candidatus Parcubacteria bacterium]|nr:MaoC family dehydratase [Candidatus Parcubacteria bacterium]